MAKPDIVIANGRSITRVLVCCFCDASSPSDGVDFFPVDVEEDDGYAPDADDVDMLLLRCCYYGDNFFSSLAVK